MGIEIREVSLALRVPFAISHSVIEQVDHIFLTMRGHAATAHGVIVQVPCMGDTVASSLEWSARIIRDHGDEIPLLDRVQDVRAFMRELAATECPDRVRYGFEMLCLDHIGKVRKQSIAELLGLSIPQTCLTAQTVTLGHSEIVAAGGFLKLKLGGRTDADYLAFVRDQPHRRFILDVNGGWSLSDLERFAVELSLPNVLALEEPLGNPSADDLAALRMMLPNTVILLDECVRDINDVKRVLAHVDGINVKVAKFGGVFASLDAIKFLKENDKKVMLGCFVESSLSITCAYALSTLADWVDLDGATFLVGDPYAGVVVNQGQVSMPPGRTRPGVGCTSVN